MQYEYTAVNRLDEPHGYSFSPYGEEFVEAYKASRRRLRNKTKTKEVLIEVEEHEFDTPTAKHLQSLLGQSTEGANEDLLRFVKKFEVSKKLWDAYDENWKKASEACRTTASYALLSLACLRQYQVTEKLMWLNCALKLNDLLLSLGEVEDEFDRELIAGCIQLEQQVVSNLYASKGVEL